VTRLQKLNYSIELNLNILIAMFRIKSSGVCALYLCYFEINCIAVGITTINEEIEKTSVLANIILLSVEFIGVISFVELSLVNK
jgi:hypothetical protein